MSPTSAARVWTSSTSPITRMVARLLELMRAGVDVIVQAPLAGDGWFGYADVLRHVEAAERRSVPGRTKCTTRSSRARRAAGRSSSSAPIRTCCRRCRDSRLSSFASSRRSTSSRIASRTSRRSIDRCGSGFSRPFRLNAPARPRSRRARRTSSSTASCADGGTAATASEREVDHLSFVAGLGRAQRNELEAQGVRPDGGAGAMPGPLAFKPSRGSRRRTSGCGSRRACRSSSARQASRS